MNIGTLKVLLIILAVILTCIIGGISYLVLKYIVTDEERRKFSRAFISYRNNTYNHLNRNHFIKEYIDGIAHMLSETGANYMLKKRINPYSYVGLCILLGTAGGFLINKLWGVIPAVISFIILLFIPRMLLYMSNKNDNGNMLRDITTIYDSLVVQTSAGMFLSRSIREASSGVRFKRLKTALMDLNVNIEMSRMDMEEALDNFNSKFKNQHLDMLVLVLKQSLRSGQASQYLRDLQDQMNDVQRAIEIRNQDRTDMKLQIVELLIFLSVIIVILAALVFEFMSNFNNI